MMLDAGIVRVNIFLHTCDLKHAELLHTSKYMLIYSSSLEYIRPDIRPFRYGRFRKRSMRNSMQRCPPCTLGASFLKGPIKSGTGGAMRLTAPFGPSVSIQLPLLL